MSDVSENKRQQVRARAKNRCEYCLSHQDYILGRLQIDHILPVVKGGSNELSNLCLACELCNQYKWTQTDGLDLETGDVVALFHPRQQKWHEHFAWSQDGNTVIGLTACGRATVDVLRLNNELARTVRRNWVRAGWHPPVD